MEWDFRDALVGGEQQREEPRIERRMRLTAHIDIAAHEDVLGVFGMKRLDLGVSRLGEIKDVVTLQSLVEEGQAQRDNDQRDEDELAAQVIKIAGTCLRADVEHHPEARLAA